MKKRKRIKLEDSLPRVDPSMFIGSGSTLHNLRLTGHPDCAYKKGTFVNIIGDSFAGKTVLAWTILALACSDKRVKDYDKFYNESENGVGFDIEDLFGKVAAKKVIREVEGGSFKNSIYIENWAKDLPKRMSKRPIIEVQDSFDNLKCKEEEKKKVEDRNYPSKPRILTEILRRNEGTVKKTGSIIFIVSQVRDNLDAVMFGSKKRRTGGRALKHYCEVEEWLAAGKPITKTFRERKEEIGNFVAVKVTKNRSTGRKGRIEFPLIVDYGIDDILSQILFLIQYKEWKKTDSKIKSPWGNYTQQALIKLIEDEGLEEELKAETTKLWSEMLKAIKVERKRKF